MTLQGIVEKISSLIWTRRYWSCGEFKLLVPFTEEHARLLVKENIIIKRGGKYLVPGGAEVLLEGDVISVFAMAEMMPEAMRFFKVDQA